MDTGIMVPHYFAIAGKNGSTEMSLENVENVLH
jgi:hypothetical protein